jgi:hypothetical protein
MGVLAANSRLRIAARCLRGERGEKCSISNLMGLFTGGSTARENSRLAARQEWPAFGPQSY